MSTLDQWLNYYECPDCDYHFYDVWDCQVNMQCERCGLKHVEPKDSYNLEDGGIPQPRKCIWTSVGQSVFGWVYDTSCEATIHEEEIKEEYTFCPFCGEEFEYAKQ